MPEHHIRREDVERWLGDSVNKAVTYHWTTVEAARASRERGVDISRSRVGAYGQGFYSATRTDPFYGEVDVLVAIRAKRPLLGDSEEVADRVDELAEQAGRRGRALTPSMAAAVRRELLRLGHDSIIVRDAGGDGIDYVIALVDGLVKVVVA